MSTILNLQPFSSEDLRYYVLDSVYSGSECLGETRIEVQGFVPGKSRRIVEISTKRNGSKRKGNVAQQDRYVIEFYEIIVKGYLNCFAVVSKNTCYTAAAHARLES